MRFPFLSLIVMLTGCTGPLAVIGYMKSGGDIVSFVETDKTLNDHALSALTDKDCSMFRILNDKEICVEYEDTAVVLNKVEPITPKAPVK